MVRPATTREQDATLVLGQEITRLASNFVTDQLATTTPGSNLCARAHAFALMSMFAAIPDTDGFDHISAATGVGHALGALIGQVEQQDATAANRVLTAISAGLDAGVADARAMLTPRGTA